MRPIVEVAAALGVPADALRLYGNDMAKIAPEKGAADGAKLVLVSAITPTPAGEGKTTTTIGLGDALARLGEKVCLALREPSLGPCFGIKGGGTGGGESQLVPSERINLHFTGDFHAITSAHNMLAATIDNHLHFNSDVGIDGRRVVWPRVIDMNDRALRGVVLGLGGPTSGQPRQSNFDITAASELMAMLCLADDANDLRTRINRALVAYDRNREPIIAEQLGVTGAMLALMQDTLFPNLVQTRGGTPALVHGGPFANIAHGCNSVIATRTAMHYADWVVTEAGFGCDLGAEKFFDIKCRGAGLDPSLVVLVASIRALKLHGGVLAADLDKPDRLAVKKGLANLDKHLDSVGHFGKKAVVALNRMAADTDDEIAVVAAHCESNSVAFARCEHFTKGGEGAEELARQVIATAADAAPGFKPIYELDQSVEDKVAAVATKIYGARGVIFDKKARRMIDTINRLGYSKLPICVAKTQSSLSDDPKLPGRPTDFDITVRDFQINAGAGFLVVLTGDILRMPGLPRKPQAETIDLVDGEIVGMR